MKILVFDIDGTLTETNRVDGKLFTDAVRASIPSVDLESFSRFVEMTDSAILRQICSEAGLEDYESLESTVRSRFIEDLTQALDTAPESFSAVPGARNVFSCSRDAGWVPAVATGGWRPSAELKLKAAEIPMTGIPLATASEANRRVDIIRRALSAAAKGADVSEIVYVGDGVWDIRACRELGIGFIGRGVGEDVSRLRALGAQVVLPDFADPQMLLSGLARPSDLLEAR